MRKTLIYLLSICLLVVMVGCEAPFHSEPNYVTYVNDSISPDLPYGGLEETWWTKDTFYSETAQTDCEIVFQNETYNGKYVASLLNDIENYTVDFYSCTDGTEFSVNSASGELMSIDFRSNQDYLTKISQSDSYCSEKQVEKSVKNFVSEYIDLKNYSLEMTDTDTKLIYDATVYTYTLTRYVDGIRTSEKLCVEFTSKGTPIYADFTAQGAFDVTMLLKNIWGKCDLSIETKLGGLLSDVSVKNFKVTDRVMTYSSSRIIVIISDLYIIVEAKETGKTTDITTTVATAILYCN